MTRVLGNNKYTPLEQIKQYDVVMWNENKYSFWDALGREEMYIVVGIDNEYLTITSETLVGWKPQQQSVIEQEKYELAIKKEWECYHVDHRNFIKIGTSKDGSMISIPCASCRYDCKRWDLEDCPLYEEEEK